MKTNFRDERNNILTAGDVCMFRFVDKFSQWTERILITYDRFANKFTLVSLDRKHKSWSLNEITTKRLSRIGSACDDHRLMVRRWKLSEKRKLKLYQINDDDYWADFSYGEAVANYPESTGKAINDLEAVVELSDDDLETLAYENNDGDDVRFSDALRAYDVDGVEPFLFL